MFLAWCEEDCSASRRANRIKRTFAWRVFSANSVHQATRSTTRRPLKTRSGMGVLEGRVSSPCFARALILKDDWRAVNDFPSHAQLAGARILMSVRAKMNADVVFSLIYDDGDG